MLYLILPPELLIVYILMKKRIFSWMMVTVVLSTTTSISAKSEFKKDISKVIATAFERASHQSLRMYTQLRSMGDVLPRSTDNQGRLVTCNPSYWTSGFYPGSLWYLYEYYNTPEFKSAAQTMTALLEKEQYTTSHHDVGFIIMCSFGNGYRLTGDTTYLPVLLQTSKSLATRFDPAVGCTRSWDNRIWQYPVIIDNMMNLELFTTTARLFHAYGFQQMAVSHADVTLANHFREDGSSYHLINYDTITGKAINKVTVQGYADPSAWARGQAWGLYGFSMMYRETGNLRYLNHAKKIARFIMEHPRLPKDKIPYWDFDSPAIPNDYRDASAGAIIASALVELSTLVKDPRLSAKYKQFAQEQICSLASDAYLAEEGENGCFILKHSVAHKPKGYEVDQPLNYADYYFLEAMIRYHKAYL